MSQEIFDVVDETDLVLGQASRSEVHARGLLHRAVHVFVFNTAGLLLLQLRSARKDEFPLMLTSSASGHVLAGESYDEAAARELAEELGLHSELQFLHKFRAGPETANEHTALYRTTTDHPLKFDREEIAELRFLPPEFVERQLARDPAQFSPPFRVAFDWYRREMPRQLQPAGQARPTEANQ